MCNISVVCLQLDLKVSLPRAPCCEFSPTYSTYQLDRVRPIGRTESSCQVFRTGFLMVAGTFWAIGWNSWCSNFGSKLKLLLLLSRKSANNRQLDKYVLPAIGGKIG
jgi:hypothetical protein